MCGNGLVALGNLRLTAAAIKPCALPQTTAMAKGSSKAADGKKGGKGATKAEDPADKQKVCCKVSSSSQPFDRASLCLLLHREGRAV